MPSTKRFNSRLVRKLFVPSCAATAALVAAHPVGCQSTKGAKRNYGSFLAQERVACKTKGDCETYNKLISGLPNKEWSDERRLFEQAGM